MNLLFQIWIELALRALPARFDPSNLAPTQLPRPPSILPPEMYTTVHHTTVADCSQRHSPSPIYKSSLQLIHSRRIVSISFFAKNHHLPNRFRRIRTISGRHISCHTSESSSDYENLFSCDSTHNDFVLPPGPSFTNLYPSLYMCMLILYS